MRAGTGTPSVCPTRPGVSFGPPAVSIRTCRNRGTGWGPGGDHPIMGCERWREILSAQLDGEETREQGAAVRQHLVACPNCRHWHDRAAEITRRARTRLGASPFELTEVVLGSAPGRRPPDPHTPQATGRPGWGSRLGATGCLNGLEPRPTASNGAQLHPPHPAAPRCRRSESARCP
ncbi:zf-HC2 domain-containing protein [Micromonospora trifolii]|uniref:zf-HC2 domain-containing protein n=1 Tax=Micromonospora trifolii TaxID=2911208 RepID=UPI003D2EAF78